MIERQRMAAEFEDFAKSFFEIVDIKILETPRLARYDFALETVTGTRAVVEVKLYQSMEVSVNIIQSLVDQSNTARQQTGFEKAIVFTNSKVRKEVRAQLYNAEHIVFYDYDVIWLFLQGHAVLSKKFDEILDKNLRFRSDPIPAPSAQAFPEIGQPKVTKREATAPSSTPGKTLCDELKAIPAGRGAKAVNFESKCIGILKYLFDGDLIGWNPQKNSSSKIHRYDLIARVASNNDFWQSLVSDYRGRYIIFEFKNYGAKIKQAQIYSTEKYLLPLAMRSTAIIISKKGADKNAIRVMAGALRETGKLILSINENDICQMLDLRDQGSDPSAILADILDNTLQELER